MYTILFTKAAEKDIIKWNRSGRKQDIEKLNSLLRELEEHPRVGTGQIEQLKDNLSGYWSRRINRTSRLVYSIDDCTVTVLVISAWGHYFDK